MRTIEIEIRGTSPLLIHRFTEENEASKKTRTTLQGDRDPRKEAERLAYIASDGSYYFSGYSIPAAMGNAGSNHKMKGSRKSLRFVVPSAVRMTTDEVTILNGEGNAKSFEVDSRPVTIPSTKGKIMRHRPRFDNWGAKFHLKVNDKVIDIDTVHQLLNEAGEFVGIGDFRPEKRGPFGTFRVVEFRDITEKELKAA